MYPIDFNIGISARIWDHYQFYMYIENGASIPTVTVNTISGAMRRAIQSEFNLKTTGW